MIKKVYLETPQKVRWVKFNKAVANRTALVMQRIKDGYYDDTNNESDFFNGMIIPEEITNTESDELL